MIKKLLYTLTSLIKLSLQITNPFEIIYYAFGIPVRLKMKNGLTFLTNQLLDAIIIKETIIDDSYRVSSLEKPVGTIIDVGAGLGDFTIMTAKLFPKATILAFEPNPEQCKLLRENIRLNNITNIESYPVAIGTKKSYQLHLFPFHIHSSTVKTDKSTKIIKVKGLRLDSFIKNKIDLLKIDCEGAELDILKSISDDKIGLIKKIVVEYHNHIIKNEDIKIVAILKKWKYQIEVEKNTLIPDTGYIFATK